MHKLWGSPLDFTEILYVGPNEPAPCYFVAPHCLGMGPEGLSKDVFYKRSGEYRLYNDRWYKPGGNCGLWIIREGLSQEVHRNMRGARLHHGDEIHLGRAVVKFQVR